jgi:predicted GNAT family acetyltransferase
MDATVRDNPAERRFELLVAGEVAGFAAYRVRDGVTVITHSEIDSAFRGKGLGNGLAGQTLDLLRSQGARVITACPFFAKYVGEHPEYDDLIEE